MRTIRLIISGACLLLASLAAIPAQAGSSDFAGPYIAVQASVNAGLLSGRYEDNDKQVTEGTGGHAFAATLDEHDLNVQSYRDMLSGGVP